MWTACEMFKIPVFCKSRDINWKPLSVTSYLGISWRAKWALNFLLTHTEEDLKWSRERLTTWLTQVLSPVTRIQQLWFNHYCKDHGLVTTGLKVKSPLNTQEAIQIIKSTSWRLVKAWINDCHWRLNHYNNKLQQHLEKLKQLIPTDLLKNCYDYCKQTSNKMTKCVCTRHQKLTWLLQNKETT